MRPNGSEIVTLGQAISSRPELNSMCVQRLRAKFSTTIRKLRIAAPAGRGEPNSREMEDHKRQMLSQETDEATPNRYLVIGLGNPGRRYQGNRHNIGFVIVDRLAETYNISMSRVQNRAIVGDGGIAGKKVILAKPQTSMNISGDSVGPLVDYYRIPLKNTLVIYDELDLPMGTIRLREKGGAGGHNGMKSIIHHLGQEFPRLRFGIGRPPGRMPAAAYVLQDFRQQEGPIVQELIEEALKAVETFLRDGIDLAMSRHNVSRHNVSRNNMSPRDLTSEETVPNNKPPIDGDS